MVGGISGGSYYQYQNTVNLLRLSGLRTSNQQAVSPVKRTAPVTSSSSAYADIQDFLKSYQSKLTGLEEAASRLTESNSRNVFQDYQVASKDASVAEASANYRLRGDTDITLDVRSLAQAQQNASASHYSQEEAGAEDSMDFEVTGPGGARVSVSVNSMNENGTAKTYDQMYREAAKAVNEQPDTGVRASVSNVDGKVSLVLEAKQEGASSGFTVSGNTGAASGIENAAVQAQDAVYTVTERGVTQSLSSSSNTISLDYGRITAELKGTGETGIYTGVDEDAVVSDVKDLVKRYNEVTEFLKKNEDRGTGAASHSSSFQRGMADEKTLAVLGISYNKDGQLEVNEETLKTALETDLEGTKSLLGGQFGIARKAADRADNALSTPVQRVVNNDLISAMNTRSQEDTAANFRYISNFARSGPYHITNYYAVGLLFNSMA